MSDARTSGLTLLEVLIALALIGVAFAVLATTQVQALRIGSDSREASDATEYANRRLEAEVNALLTPTSFEAAHDAGAVTVPIDDGRYQGFISVAPAGGSYLQEGLMHVEVEMTSPADVQFDRLVSCLDVTPPPSVALPSPCPE